MYSTYKNSTTEIAFFLNLSHNEKEKLFAITIKIPCKTQQFACPFSRQDKLFNSSRAEEQKWLQPNTRVLSSIKSPGLQSSRAKTQRTRHNHAQSTYLTQNQRLFNFKIAHPSLKSTIIHKLKLQNCSTKISRQN